MRSTSFILVRHAHAHWRPDEMRPLSARGRRDALRVAEILAPQHPDAIYSSPYRRARETVEPLAERLEMEIREDARLRERGLGDGWHEDWEAAIRRTWEDFSFSYPGGETNAGAQERAMELFRELIRIHEGQTLVLATHGNLMVLLLNGLDSSLGFDFWCSLCFPDIHRLQVGSEGIVSLKEMWQPSEEDR